MANPFAKINPDPVTINADGLANALSVRRQAQVEAPGVFRRSDYAVSFNAGMGVTVSGGEAVVQGGDVTNQGPYYCYSDASKNITVNAAPASGTSRIDQVILRVFDSAHDASGLSEGRIEIIEGVPQATADLNQNRDAAAAVLTGLTPASKSYILLADILVTGGVSSLSSGVIRDRRPFGTEGGVASISNALDPYLELACPRPHPAIPLRTQTFGGGSGANLPQYGGQQAAALVWLDRTVVASKLIFNYRTDLGAAGPSGTYMAGVCDASGRDIFHINGQALNTTANIRNHDVMTMPTTTFYRGYYWYVFGLTSSSTNSAYFWGMGADVGPSPGAQVMVPNVYLFNSTGGATFPAARNIASWSDGSGASLGAIPVPLYGLAR